MISVLPDVRPAGRYTKPETMAILGMSKSTLDRHTIVGPKGDKNKIHCELSASNGRRVFKGVEILRFWNNTK